MQLDTAKAMGTVGAGFLPQLIYGVGDNLCVSARCWQVVGGAVQWSDAVVDFTQTLLSLTLPSQLRSYEDGISCSGDRSRNCKMDATSHRFVDTFENVYTAASLQVPWYINAGNVSQ